MTELHRLEDGPVLATPTAAAYAGGLHLANAFVAWGLAEHRRGEQVLPQSTAEACTDSRLKSSGSLQSEQLASNNSNVVSFWSAPLCAVSSAVCCVL